MVPRNTALHRNTHRTLIPSASSPNCPQPGSAALQKCYYPFSLYCSPVSGDKPVEFEVVCPQNGTAAKKRN